MRLNVKEMIQISFPAKVQQTEGQLLHENEVQKVLVYNVSDWNSGTNSL
jgi:hypothetical protein